MTIGGPPLQTQAANADNPAAPLLKRGPPIRQCTQKLTRDKALFFVGDQA